MLQIFSICLQAVCEKKRTSVIWQMTGWLRHPVPRAGSQSLLVATAGAAELLQWARPGPTSCGEQLAGWVESVYGDVLGASGQGTVSRAVSSPNCPLKELYFFQNAQRVQSKQVPCVCTFRWLRVTNLESAVIFLWNPTCYTSSCCKDSAEVYSVCM